MKKEILFEEELSVKDYLNKLLSIYPYDIEKAMVFSLLSKTTYPHPVLLNFISYFQTIQKFQISKHNIPLSAALRQLFAKMSSLSQKNNSVLHPHHFAMDATFFICHYTFSHPYTHLPLHKIPFIHTMQLHTVPFYQIPPLHNEIAIIKQHSFIFRDISMDASAFYALSIQIADKQGIVYITKDCLSLAICTATMYTLCPPCEHQDFILIFGLASNKNKREYYFDETNELLIALVCGDATMHHFLYLKEMMLTLYNAICIRKHDLPLHASMIEIKTSLKTYGIVFAGEQGTGKSEMLLAMFHLCTSLDLACTPLYDDHGTLHYLDNEIVSTGGEISCCKNINDMKKRDVFNAFLSGIFLQEEHGDLYQITPLITHKQSMEFHKVTHIFYLDNVAKEKGWTRIQTLSKCQEIFLNGCYRNAKNIVCSSFFFNAFGPYQQQTCTTQLVNDFLTILYVQDIPIYTLHTRMNRLQKDTFFERMAACILKEILL